MPPCDPDCIFCKIVAGSIPCHKLYEDQNILAFLDVEPLSKGHTLIIPKGHWGTLDQVPEEVSATIGRILPRLSKAIRQTTEIADFNVLQNNGKQAHQAVSHVHFHIIPKTAQSGLGIEWPSTQLNHEQAAKFVETIRDLL